MDLPADALRAFEAAFEEEAGQSVHAAAIDVLDLISRRRRRRRKLARAGGSGLASGGDPYG
jgi:hypothetical protein